MSIHHRNAAAHRSKTEAGQSLVEFALMLPFLLLIIVGTIDLGRAYLSYMSIVNAAREGARYGASHPTETAAIVTHAKQEVDTNFIRLVDLSVNPRCADASGVTASCVYMNTMEVTVSLPFHLITAEAVGGTTITLRAKEEMEIFKR